MIKKFLQENVYEIILFIFGACLLILAILSGCAPHYSSVPITQVMPAPVTHAAALIQTVYKTNWLATIGIIGIGLSVFAFLQGWKQGIPALLSCAAILGLTLTVTRYGVVLAFGGLVLLALFVLYQIFIRNKALTEVVAGVQTVRDTFKKHNTTSEAVQANTLLPGVTKQLADAQSPSTVKLVEQIKTTLPPVELVP